MPMVKYVGLKLDGEQAFKERTGIVWMPGSSHQVSNEHAALMVKHPDVWEIDLEPKPSGPTLADAAPAAAPQEITFGDMTDDQIHAFAKTEGFKVHHKLAGDNLRAKVAELLTAKG